MEMEIQKGILGFFQHGSRGYKARLKIWEPDFSDFGDKFQPCHGAPMMAPIYHASSAGLRQRVRLLLDEKADINEQGGRYSNALQVASYGGHSEIVYLLLERGADVNAQGGEYANALGAASATGHRETLELLN
ncbi:hypothetical protein Aspvir_002926 [Aspergillus viridinutans]|uniref:Ankyrin n=1 Tax=Aspergillus viridinutans TaxID=75553 RepID=A0A9P3C369_ASPVI|nr:uncharacterized protein Aspvir_002926 [Aspergillus viridinutans]GIK07268.1 hypothetical protein Aspvir_002926 [Aspergillus viridinutans]